MSCKSGKSPIGLPAGDPRNGDDREGEPQHKQQCGPTAPTVVAGASRLVHQSTKAGKRGAACQERLASSYIRRLLLASILLSKPEELGNVPNSCHEALCLRKRRPPTSALAKVQDRKIGRSAAQKFSVKPAIGRRIAELAARVECTSGSNHDRREHPKTLNR